MVVEFWADFNKENCFSDWGKLNVPYYRVDISKAPQAKKKYRVRMAPTIIIFNQGSKEKNRYPVESGVFPGTTIDHDKLHQSESRCGCPGPTRQATVLHLAE